MVVVELLGLPGAGKSTFGAALAAGLPGLERPDLAVGPQVAAGRRLTRKAVAAARTSLRVPLLSAGVAADLARGQRSRGAVPARWLQWQHTQALLAAAATPDGGPAAVRLLDEGALQCLWSAGLRGDVEAVLRRLAASSRWARPDLAVVVDVPPDVAAQRLADRPSQHSRTQRLAPPERLAELRRGADLVDRLAQWWPTVAGRDVLRVDGTGDPGLAADRVGAALLELAAGRVSPQRG